MDTTTATSNRPSARRVLGALGSAVAVAVVGVGVLPAATASAAGVRTTTVSGVPATPHRALADPAATGPVATAAYVRYRVTPRGTVAAL